MYKILFLYNECIHMSCLFCVRVDRKALDHVKPYSKPYSSFVTLKHREKINSA